ncbi:MAG: flavodoxin family protein [Candidatus Heimdallarchaeota archaeon]
MKILGVLGSPRSGGNSDILLDEALRGARDDGAEVEKIVLDRLQIHGCRDCKSCNETGRCVQEDDMQLVLEKILQSQGIIHSCPIYFYSMTAQMKAYLDRWCALYDEKWKFHSHYLPRMRGKNMAVIVVCGDSDIKMAELAIVPFQRLVQAETNILKWGGSLAVPSVDVKGEVQQNKKALEKAYQLGWQMVETSK